MSNKNLFTMDEQYELTEHEKILEICSKKYNNNFNINVELELQQTLLTKLDYNNLSVDNINNILIKLKLDTNSQYDINKFIKALVSANNFAEERRKEIKNKLNKNVEIKLILN